MSKQYMTPTIKVLRLDDEILNTQDSRGEQDGQTILSNDAMFDGDEQSEETLPTTTNVWDE